MESESLPPNPPFRPNRQVFVVLALLLLALALPITMVIIGTHGIPKDSPAPPDATALRQSVEGIAAQRFGEPKLSDGRREIPFSGSTAEMAARRTLIEKAAKAVGGSVLPGDSELLIGIPGDRAGEFEVSALLPPATQELHRGGESVLYRITFSPP